MSMPRTLPKLHIWIFNHPMFFGIGDQLHYIFKYFNQLGYKITCGRLPRLDSCNIIIENFNNNNLDTVKDFCITYGKSVGIVLTEHVDIETKIRVELDGKTTYLSEIYLHGKTIDKDFDYLPKAVLIQRTNNLLSLSRYTNCYFRLGDLPAMKGFEILTLNKNIHTLWFPKLDDHQMDDQRNPSTNFIFIGARTTLRDQVIENLMAEGFTFVEVPKSVSVKRRHQLFKQAKYCLNIPQDKTWQWLSTMRIVSALQAGVPTLSIGTNDSSAISACTLQINLQGNDIDIHTISKLMASHKTKAIECLDNYRELTNQTQSNSDLAPLFRSWALTDGIL